VPVLATEQTHVEIPDRLDTRFAALQFAWKGAGDATQAMLKTLEKTSNHAFYGSARSPPRA
jgi:hypothetical protein